MADRKTAPIWKISTKDLEKLVRESKLLGHLLTKLGYKNLECYYTRRSVKARLKQDKIDYSHFTANSYNSQCYSRNGLGTKTTNDEMFKIDSKSTRSAIKKRLRKENLIKNECGICGNPSSWNGKILSLQLDHINGINNDNRIENLRLLCPNCHSQTDTFGGKRHKKRFKKTTEELIESQKVRAYKQRKVKQRPSANILQKQANELGYCATGRLYGVCDNTIRDWIDDETKHGGA